MVAGRRGGSRSPGDVYPPSGPGTENAAVRGAMGRAVQLAYADHQA